MKIRESCASKEIKLLNWRFRKWGAKRVGGIILFGFPMRWRHRNNQLVNYVSKLKITFTLI
jgi:hypothetical protein